MAFDDGMIRCAEETLDIVKEMTTLCPAVQENIIRLQVMDEESGEIYAEHVRKNATLQAEWERERVRKAIDTMISTMDSFYDGAVYIGNIDFIKELPKKGEMIEARIHALMLLKKELGIEQEEKEK
jgi:hypothetical protein